MGLVTGHPCGFRDGLRQRMIEFKTNGDRTVHQHSARGEQLLLKLNAKAVQRELIGGGHQQRSVGQTQLDTVAKPQLESFSADFTSHCFTHG